MKYIEHSYRLLTLLMVCFCLVGGSSCDYIHDELPVCRHTLRFVYRHNIKQADAFAYEMTNQSVAKNVRLYIFDATGKYLSTRVIEGGELAKNEIDMSDLQPGTYKLLAWAGLNDTDYEWTDPTSATSLSDFTMRVKQSDHAVRRELSGLFQGELEYTIPEGGATDTEFPLVKNTNKIRFVLVDANRGTALNADAFQVVATTTNGDLNAHNAPVTKEAYSWYPYLQQVKQVPLNNTKETYEAVCIELNTLRLIDDQPSSLSFRYAAESTPFLNVSLTGLLKLTQIASHNYADQEYLDRQDEYVITVYVDIVAGRAHCLEVLVDDWTVRLQDITLADGEL